MPKTREQQRTSHQRRWGKRWHEVNYGEVCPLCGSRIDEFGLCSCGAGGG